MNEIYEAVGLVVVWVVIAFLLFAIWGDTYWYVRGKLKERRDDKR